MKLSPTSKVSIKQLKNILGVSLTTAKNDYINFLHILNLKRNFLIVNDLIELKIIV